MTAFALIAYVLCDLAAFAVGYFLPESPWTPYVSPLVAYHLFLACLLVYLWLDGEQKMGFSYSIPMTVITHLAFMGALIWVVMGREYIPQYGILRYGLGGLAFFEATWLFEGKKKALQSVESGPLPEGSSDDYDLFVEYLRGKDRKFLKPGRSIHEEYEAWSADRAKRRMKEEKEQSVGSRE
jgi:hypothetical protein